MNDENLFVLELTEQEVGWVIEGLTLKQAELNKQAQRIKAEIADAGDEDIIWSIHIINGIEAEIKNIDITKSIINSTWRHQQ